MSRYEDELKAAREMVGREYGQYAHIWVELLEPQVYQPQPTLTRTEAVEEFRKTMYRIIEMRSKALKKEEQSRGIQHDSMTGYLCAIHERELSRRIKEFQER